MARRLNPKPFGLGRFGVQIPSEAICANISARRYPSTLLLDV